MLSLNSTLARTKNKNRVSRSRTAVCASAVCSMWRAKVGCFSGQAIYGVLRHKTGSVLVLAGRRLTSVAKGSVRYGTDYDGYLCTSQ